jgi:hypothetical protein
LTTCIRHYTLLEQGQGVKSDQDEDDKGDGSKSLLKNLDLLPRYCLGSAATGSSNTTTASLVDRLRDLVSIKKLKQWKMVASPCVIIVCLSARRAVAILKELSPLHVRSAKLFPKNGSLSEQHEQLATTSFGLAVATPHRLYQLLSSSSAAAMASTTASPTAPASKQGHGNKQSNKHQPQHIKHQQTKTRTRTLSLEHCKLLIFDCHVSNKQYTVCTLPDTAPHCAKLVRDYVLPMCVSSKHHSSIKTETAADSHCRIAFV